MAEAAPAKEPLAARGPIAEIFAERSAIEPRALITIFHRWIQADLLTRAGLFDVADYSHLCDGPLVLLVCGRGFLSLDRQWRGGSERLPRAGLLWRRRGGEKPAGEGLREAAAIALEAAAMLEKDAAGAIRFSPGEILVGFDDRLRAPNDPARYAAFLPHFEALARDLYGSATVAPAGEPDGGLRALIRAAMAPASLDGLLASLRAKP